LAEKTVPAASSVHEFGPFRLDTGERLLLRAGQPVSLTPKAFDLLVYLVERHGRLVSKKDLLSAVWSDTFVEEANLSYTISALRKALGDGQDGEQYIQTVPTRGYRFLAPVAGSEEPPVPFIAEADPAASVSRRWKNIALLSAALVAILLAMLVGLATIHFREKRPRQARVVFTVPRDPAFPQYNLPAISPDGTWVVFFGPGDGGRFMLWSRALDSLAVQSLAATEITGSPPYPFWSPDGRFIAFFSGGNLKTIAGDGGASQTLAPAPDAAGGSWGADGTIIFSPKIGPLYRVSAAGGAATPLRELNSSQGEVRQAWPHFLPDGKHYLYVARSSDAERTGIYLGTVGTQESRLLIRGESNVVYSPPGYLIFVRDGTLVAQAFDPGTLQLAGGAFPLPSYGGENFPALGSTFGLFSVSQNGVLAYAGAHLVDVQPTWYDRDGKVVGTIGEPGEYGTVRLSPDDKRAALERSGARAGVWVLDVATGMPTRLTFGTESDPVWSPDGRELVFADTSGALHRRVIGTNADVVLMSSGDADYPEYWTPDGAAILFIKNDGRSLYRLPLSGSRRPEVLLETPFPKDQFRVSPDGRWIAFNSLESGRWEVYAAAFPSFTDKRQVSRDGGAQPLWRNDGKQLFYLSLQGKLMAIDTTLGASLEANDPVSLFQAPISVNPLIDQYAVARDGQRFIFCVPGHSAGQPITVVVNWTAGLNVFQGATRVPQ